MIVVNLGKITDQEFPELDQSVQLRRTLHGSYGGWLADLHLTQYRPIK